MNKHTPGPWSIQYGVIQGGDGHAIIDSNDMGALSRIADVLFHDDTEGETKANAILIAAAPELLAALRKLMDAWPEGMACEQEASTAFDDAYAAIAKVTGCAQ